MEKQTDNLLDFFNLGKDFKKTKIQGLQAGGHVKSTDLDDPSREYNYTDVSNEPSDYYKQYREAERQRMIQSAASCHDSTTASVPEGARLDYAATLPTNDMQDDHIDLTKQFNFKNISRDSQQLPISAVKEKIVDFVSSYPVVVISGFTGCGKTTQVPQYILDKHAADRKRVNIIVTQPRKLAARSVAERVCQERGWELGKLVGYQVGLDKAHKTPDTRLLYVTTGVLKRMLIQKKSLNDWTHIVLDEVHEREQDMDFVMLICKKLIHSNSRGVKIILMSATMNERKFCEYFSYVLPGNQPQAAPSIVLPNKKKNNKVQEYSLEDFQKFFPPKEEMPRFAIGEAKLEIFCIKVCRILIEELDALEKQMKEIAVNEGQPAPDTGAVLVFLPGLAEIQTVQDWLKEKDVNRKGTDQEPKWWILPLHSSIPVEEHKLIFKKAPNFQRKIILSTNIAESSVTVPDIVYIIDFCLTKNVRADQDTNYPRLVLEWASRQQCVQRMGRAGRVQDGRVFRLVNSDFYQNLNEEHEPELKRAPLSKVVLDTKLLGFGSPKELLALTMDPPDLLKLQKTIVALKEIGALLTTVNNQQSYDDGDLTVLGEIIANLPVDVRIGKLVVYGHVFNVLEDAIIIAAGLNGKSMFTAPFEKRIQAYKNKLWWADKTFSDCFAILLAFKTWMQKQRRGEFRMGDRAEGRRREQHFCDSSFLQMKVLHEMKLQVDEIEKNLEQFDMKPSQPQGDGKGLGEEQRFLILRLIMFGAFYPNYFQRQQNCELEKQADRILNGRNPRTCVYLTGFPRDQVNFGVLYENKFKKMFASAGYYQNEAVTGNIDIEVEGHNVIVEFKKPVNENAMTFSTKGAAGEVIPPVYVATKMRNTGPRNRNLNVKLYSVEEAQKKLDEWKKVLRECGDPGLSVELVDQVSPPAMSTTRIKFSIQHVNDPNSFWIHLKDQQEQEEEIHSIIGDNVKYLVPPDSNTCAQLVKSGAIVLAPFEENNESEVVYYRARLTGVDRSGCASVFFIDYGNVDRVVTSSLRVIGTEFISRSPGIVAIPGLALECSLSHIHPNKITCAQGVWSDQAVQEFKTLLLGSDSSPDKSGVIFSVTKASSGHTSFLVSLESLEVVYNGKNYEIKKYLLGRKFAEKVTESFQSEEDAKERSKFGSYNTAMQEHLNDYKGRYKVNKPRKEVAEDMNAQTVSCELRGPFSPLEYSVICAYRQGSKKLVTVDMDSVNSVLLDPNPSDPHDQWMVAAHVGVSPSGENLLLRNTTWLPARPGLGALAAMIFAPQVELRTDKERTKIIGFLAGLGPKAMARHNRQVNKCSGHEETHSYFPEHDMEVKFDVKVDNDDVNTINKIRYWMNQMLSRQDDGVLGLSNPRTLNKAQDGIKNHFQTLFSKDREVKEKEHVPAGREYRWNLLHGRHRMTSILAEQDKYFLKMIDGVNLHRPRDDQAVVEAAGSEERLKAEKLFSPAQ